MRWLIALLALPLFGQLTVSCPSPGNVATLTWSDPAHPSVILRVEDNPDNKTEAHPYAVAKATLHLVQSDIVATGGTVTLPTAPGPKLAYAVSPNGQPYFQSSPAKPFQCELGPPSPPTPTPTPTPTPVPTPSPAASCTRVTVSGTEVGVCISDIDIVLQCQATGSFSFSVIAPGKAILHIPVGSCP